MTPEGYKKHKELIEAWANGATIQVLGIKSQEWITLMFPCWSEDMTYRIKPATPDYINWDHVDSRFKYMARDKDGHTCLYIDRPEIPSTQFGGMWYTATGTTKANCFSSYKRGDIDWRDSLVCRHDK